MAVTVGRWAAAAALGCGAIGVAYAPPQPSLREGPLPDSRPAEHLRVERLNGAYGNARDLLGAARLRDSLARAVRAGTGVPVQVSVRGTLSDPSRRLVREAAERVWADLGALPGARLIVILDASERPARHAYVLPSTLDGRTCAAFIPLGWSVAWLRRPATSAEGSNLEPWLRDAIAPCLFYSAFGQPGPAVEAWLERRAFTPISTADWSALPAPIPGIGRPGVNLLSSSATFDALACLDGRPARCRRALLSPLPSDGQPRVSGVVRRSRWAWSFPYEDRLLAALVHQMGRERFTQFWRSPAELEPAFAAAFGRPLETWVTDWARGIVPGLPPFGPAPRPHAVLFGFALAAGVLAAVVGLVGRRQVG
jgi:hypothetical protein